MNRIYIIALVLLLGSCTKENFIDTGISNGIYDCTMYEFLQQDSYNWDSTVLIIKRAKLEDHFDGTNPNFTNITFWGPNNHSIRRYIIENSYKCVNDIPVKDCRDLLLRHISRKKYLKEDIAMSPANITGEITGGTIITCEGGNQVHAYNRQEPYGGVAEAGPINLRLFSLVYKRTVPMATPNLQTNTGVIHALNGTYTFGEI